MAGRAWPWVLRTVGLLGVIYETLVENFDRPTLLAVFAAMMGLSDFLESRDK